MHVSTCNIKEVRASPLAALKRLLKPGRRSIWTRGQNQPASAAPKMCWRVLEPKLLAGAPEPAPARQDSIGGTDNTRQLCPDTSGLHASECGRDQRFL
jgi:hypothetical protein